MTDLVQEFADKYRVQDLVIFENDCWSVSLRPEQKTPFSLFISIKDEVFRMSDLSIEQHRGLQECYVYVESLVFLKLKATKINYYSLMMVDPIVHFHVFPRFESSVRLDNKVIHDVYYPKPVDLMDGFSLDILRLCLNYLRGID